MLVLRVEAEVMSPILRTTLNWAYHSNQHLLTRDTAGNNDGPSRRYVVKWAHSRQPGTKSAGHDRSL